ncbi:MAG: ATP-binding protein [Xanthobacteraceae bacterium]
MAITNRFFVQSTIALLFVGFLALIGIVGTTFWLAERAQIYFAQVIEARDTRGAAVELRNAMQTAESSQRGFLFTGNEIYLAPYDAAKMLAQRQLDALNRMLAPYGGTNVAIQRLTTIITDKFTEIDQTIALKRERRDAEALALVRTNRGKALTDEANVFFSGIIRAADDRLTVGVGEQQANAAWLRLFSSVGGIIIVAVVGGAAYTVLRYTRELGEARDEVSMLNSGLEERVRDRTADVARANQEIQRFAYIVTHDLRAPLVNIMGFTRELEGGIESVRTLIDRSEGGGNDPIDPVLQQARIAATEDMPEAIGFIRSSTKKMDKLINAILTLSREGQRTLRPERLDLKTVVLASATAVQHQLSQADGEINLHLDIPPIVNDRLSLEQIIGNLLDNAIKYRSKDRPLRIDVRADISPDDRVSIEIADNGRGISSGDIERVFELFRRAGAQDTPGEGIGLAYVQTVLRNLGGEIAVTSALDVGTTFRVVLPRTLDVSGSSPA